MKTIRRMTLSVLQQPDKDLPRFGPRYLQHLRRRGAAEAARPHQSRLANGELSIRAVDFRILSGTGFVQ
jgi:hypothetical protein